VPRTVKCPTCRKETAWKNNSHRPFCSKRCQLIDLGAWIEERYRIPADEIDLDRDLGDDEDDSGNKLQ
jgi:endogenous inhibitor of DNA gyrase (YacG/DUF329 family)